MEDYGDQGASEPCTSSTEATASTSQQEESSPTPTFARGSRKKQEEKHRKKDPRSWENVIKVSSAMASEQKMAAIEYKYRELYNENRKLTLTNQQLTKEFAVVQKDRDYQQSELAKSIIARARIENLCRELQKQNKQIKDENMAKIKEEEERRKEVSLKFADKLSDINTMMDENKEKSDKLREENLKMTAKLADLYNQFQIREDDIAKMSHQLELERQYFQATLAKMELEIKAEKELHNKEQALMKANVEKSEANCCVLVETIKGLQEHIDVYKNQYDDFETTMSKSAKVFDNFKFEIANMTKQVSTLEQEAQVWKNKYHDSMKALVEMSEIKKNQDIHIQALEKKNDQLQKLCRQIQTDRATFLKILKTHGLEPPSTISKEKPAVEEEIKKAESPKMTKKEKELETLKENLKAMQDELSKLSIEEVNKCEDQKTDNETSQVPNEEESAKEKQPVPEALETPNPVSVSSQDASNAIEDKELPQDNPVEKPADSPAADQLIQDETATK